MIRSFLPTDLMVVLFQGEPLSDVARTRDSIGRGGARYLRLATILLQGLNPRDRRRSWVMTEGLSVRGLASVRNCSQSTAWEIDHLIINEEDPGSCSSLLDRLSLIGGELGVERVFLRLPAESPLLAAADEAGFSPYVNEYLYAWERRQDEVPNHKSPSLFFPRRKQVDDDYRVFELYEKCVPIPVRRVRGMTLKEWQANKERGRGKGTEWVFENGGGLSGWMETRTSRRAGQFEVMAIPGGELGQIVECGMKFLDNCRYLFCLVPEFEGETFRVLERLGFSRIAKYSALAKQPVCRAERPCLVPARA